MSLFTKAFWLDAFEKAVVTGAGTFAASDFFAGSFTLHGLEVAASAAGLAALYALVKQIGTTNGLAAAKAGSTKGS